MLLDLGLVLVRLAQSILPTFWLLMRLAQLLQIFQTKSPVADSGFYNSFILIFEYQVLNYTFSVNFLTTKNLDLDFRFLDFSKLLLNSDLAKLHNKDIKIC